MASRCVILAILALSTVYAGDVPVLIWSPDRPLSDLPQAPAVDSIPHGDFHNNYLQPLLGKEANVLVAFLQDKLHINDISKYADVYSQNSDGGAFKNIKGLLDDNFSLELPRVLGSHQALDTLRQNFPGTVHDVNSVSDLSGLDLQGKGHYLVIVRLAPVAGASNEEAAIAANDEMIGKVSDHLQKRSVKYTALYTAETSEKRDKRSGPLGRHLLEVGDLDTDGVFYNISYTNGTLYAFLRSLSVCVAYHYDPDSPPTFCPSNFTVSTEDLKNGEIAAKMGGNNTLGVTLNVNNIKANHTSDTYNFTLLMNFENQFDRWEFKRSELTVSNSSTGSMLEGDTMVTRDYDSVVSLLYSFHCSSMKWYPRNMTKDRTVGYVELGGFQIQPFNTPGSGFLLSQDCTGWFSTAIWMALFPTAVNLIILLFGMYMVTSLSSNDRFDDPKGKPLTVHAAE